MRTTLDIDDVVLSAARGLAAAEKMSLGRAVSELALRGLRARSNPAGTDARVDAVWPGFVPLDGFGPATPEELADALAEMDDDRDRAQTAAGLDGPR